MSQLTEQMIDKYLGGVVDGYRTKPLNTRELRQYWAAINSMVRKLARGFKVIHEVDEDWMIEVPDERTADKLVSALKRNFLASKLSGYWTDKGQEEYRINVYTVAPHKFFDKWQVIVTTNDG